MRAKTEIIYNRDGSVKKNREQRRSDPSQPGGV